MRQEVVKELSDSELSQVVVWAQEEQKARALRRKLDVVARIKALAQEVGVTVSVGNTRGRPANLERKAKNGRHRAPGSADHSRSSKVHISNSTLSSSEPPDPLKKVT